MAGSFFVGTTVFSLRVGRAIAGAALLSMVMAGCSSMGGSGNFTVFADPGKYRYHNCAQLETERKAQTVREKDLRELIARAERGAGGSVVSAVAYRSDYQTAVENLRLVDEAVQEKNCAPVRRSDTVIQ